ncbi:hypothetical protein ACLX1H_005052 [Fusarium chlamydosporum]
MLPRSSSAWPIEFARGQDDLLAGVSPYRHLQTYDANSCFPTEFFHHSNAHTAGSDNGFVWSACRAYNEGAHFTLHPDDVWLAILQQIRCFESQGRQERILREYNIDIPMFRPKDFETPGALTLEMEYLVTRTYFDKKKTELLMPSFTTTRSETKVAAAVLLLGRTRNEKFNRGLRFGNDGTTKIVLRGVASDWVAILDKLDELKRVEEESTELQRFIAGVRPVVSRLHHTARERESAEAAHFWSTMVRRTTPGQKDSNIVNGWITAFCYFDERGQVRQSDKEQSGHDGLFYQPISLDDIPAGTASMDLHLVIKNNSKSATIIGGSLGIMAGSVQGEWCYRALPGWVLCMNDTPEMVQKRKDLVSKMQGMIWKEQENVAKNIKKDVCSTSAAMLSMNKLTENLKDLGMKAL